MKGGVDSDYNDNVHEDSVDVIAARSVCIKIFRWSFIVFFLSYNSKFSIESHNDRAANYFINILQTILYGVLQISY